jgi:signal transduction histidine kinase
MVFVLFIVFNRRRVKFILEKQEALRKAEMENARVRIETQEMLLRNISWELHDNVGQLLSVSKMQLSMLPEPDSESERKILNDTMQLLTQVLDDIRSLSRTLNTDHIGFMGLVKATQFEIERLNRLNYIKAEFSLKGIPAPIKNDDEIVLFRIIQEWISNVIKHAKATHFKLEFIFDHDTLTITADDNGSGMDMKPENYGLGMKNIISRMKLLNGEFKMENKKEGGLRSILKYPLSLTQKKD